MNGCPRSVALAPTDVVNPAEQVTRRTPPAAWVQAEAERFLTGMGEELGLAPAAVRARLDAVADEVARTGTYRHDVTELEHGAKVAWRNHTRCLGKLFWRTLVVRDCRHVTSVPAFADQLAEHLRIADHGGRIRPVLSVFAPDTPQRPGPRLLNAQLVAYAGYRRGDGTVLGDPAGVALTELLTGLGWRGPGGRFDPLPPVLRRAGQPTVHLPLPAAATAPVPIVHPSLPGLAGLGLQWYRFPTVSSLRLEIGGVSYPMAPFSGWYMATEIATRDLADTGRYDVLPAVAAACGLPTGPARTLWKDRALIELNTAVLHSYEVAGVRVVDHHTLTDQFGRYVENERRRGREVAAEWSWMVPPTSPSATRTFHMSFDPQVRTPNFFRDPDGVELT